MATNQVIRWFDSPMEQGLIEDLIIEAIKIYGYDIYYMPRVSVNEDDMLGEDPLNKFEDAVPIEAYVENVEGFGGQGDVFSKFGITVDDQITFTIANRRWTEIRTEKVLSEDGYPVALEESNGAVYVGEYESALLEPTGAYDLSALPRPMEGDLIYFPIAKKLFEITFVEHEKMFYPLGRRMIYQIKCILYKYSSEEINTGNTEIDGLTDGLSLDIMNDGYLTEDGYLMTDETGAPFLLEEKRIEDIDPQANNELFQRDVTGVVDFSEMNPFVYGGRY